MIGVTFGSRLLIAGSGDFPAALDRFIQQASNFACFTTRNQECHPPQLNRMQTPWRTFPRRLYPTRLGPG